MNELNFREYAPADLDQVVALERKAFPVGPYTRPMLRRIFSVRGSFNFVAEENGRVFGYVIAIPLDGESADVESIAVDPDFQRSGLGSRLMALIEGEMRNRGFSMAILEVRDRNTEAIAFYTRHGYSALAHLPEYYHEIFRGSRGAYRMSKKL